MRDHGKEAFMGLRKHVPPLGCSTVSRLPVRDCLFWWQGRW